MDHLVQKVALKLVYSKIDKLINSMQEGKNTSFDNKDLLNFFLNDPMYQIDSIISSKLLS